MIENKTNPDLTIQDYIHQHPTVVLEHPNIGFCIFYPNGKIIYSNEKFVSIYRMQAKDIRDKRIQEFCRFTLQNLPEILKKLEHNQQILPLEMYAHGCYYLYKIQGHVKDNKNFLTLTLIDITHYRRIELALEKANKQLEQTRLLDRITGLNNFTVFEAKIQEIYNRKFEEPIGFILLDIDKFKNFNLENGFEYGDIALKKIGATLDKLTAHQHQSLFHLGGDEFIFILPNIKDWSLYTYAEQIRAEIYKLNLYFSSGIDHRLTVSLAIHKFVTGTKFDINFFLVKLKDLIVIAKQQGGNCWISTHTNQISTFNDS